MRWPSGEPSVHPRAASRTRGAVFRTLTELADRTAEPRTSYSRVVSKAVEISTVVLISADVPTGNGCSLRIPSIFVDRGLRRSYNSGVTRRAAQSFSIHPGNEVKSPLDRNQSHGTSRASGTCHS